MKVVIINYTDTVGKTTIAANLLSPRMDGVPIYAIESINETAENLGLGVDPLKRSADKDLVFKRAPSIKALTTHKQASTVAAYFTRQAQQNEILPAHRQAIRRVDTNRASRDLADRLDLTKPIEELHG